MDDMVMSTDASCNRLSAAGSGGRVPSAPRGRWEVALLWVAALVLVAGCGKPSGLVEVSGAVTFDGAPLDHGGLHPPGWNEQHAAVRRSHPGTQRRPSRVGVVDDGVRLHVLPPPERHESRLRVEQHRLVQVGPPQSALSALHRHADLLLRRPQPSSRRGSGGAVRRKRQDDFRDHRFGHLASLEHFQRGRGPQGILIVPRDPNKHRRDNPASRCPKPQEGS